MQVGIYTNRLPSPPIGGIPSFLNGLFHGLKSVGVRARFLLPNASHDVRNGFVSQGSIESALAIALRDTSQLPSDVTISLSDWRYEALYSPDDLVPLAGLSTTDMVGRADFCDLMIIAGSPLLFLSASPLEEFMRKLRCPVLLVVLFPLQELTFYCGSTLHTMISGVLASLSQYVKAVVVPSTFVLRELQDSCFLKAPLKLIRHGVNDRLFRTPALSDAPPRRRALLISRATALASHKNISTVCRLWPMIRDRIDDAVLTVVGPGTEAYDNGDLRAGIEYLGEVSESDKIAVINDTRAIISASGIEAFGLTVAEGLAAAVPCIALNHPAISELVTNGVNGLLVRSSNDTNQPDVDALRNAIVSVLSDDELYMRLRTNCALTPGLRGWRSMTEDYLVAAGPIRVR